MKYLLIIPLLFLYSPMTLAAKDGEVVCGRWLGPKARHDCYIYGLIEEPGISREKKRIKILFSSKGGKIIDRSVCGDKEKGSILRRECRKEAKRRFADICKRHPKDQLYCHASRHLVLIE